MRQGGSCDRCGAVRHGKRRHVMGSPAFTVCALPECEASLCEKHGEWDSVAGGYVCKKHRQDRAKAARGGR